MPDPALPPLADLAATLYTAVLSDVLDEAGFMDQALKPFVRPLDEASVLCGFARTGLYRKVYHVEPARNPYEIEMDLIDGLSAGEVAVLACDGPTDRIAPWGELLTTAARVRGAAGCLTDGLVRDVRRIRETGFPVFAGGIGPLDSKGRAEMAAMDVPVEVAVLACDGPTDRIAPWGELLTTAARVRGAAGCLTDGLVRDVRRIRETGFPVFAGGIGPLDSKGRAEMAAMDVPVEVAGVRVEPGDLIFGDVDGCVAIPKAAAAKVVRRALEKVAAEDRTRDALLAGETLRAVFARFGVL
ncbi:MAG TPA: RraA family protein [Beijerinckiaceae bacterium]